MKHSITLLFCLICFYVNAQNVGIGTKSPQNKLHVAGGVRIDSLASKKDSGLILHNDKGDVYSLSLTGKKTDVLRGDGTFAAAAAATDAWLLGGNAGTDSNVNFLGTTDNQPVRFRVNNRFFGSFGNNVVLGFNTNPNMFRQYNVAIGDSAMAGVSGGLENVAIGRYAMAAARGHRNIAIGAGAFVGQFDPSVGNTGEGNVAVGINALRPLAFGLNNTAIGTEALRNIAYTSANTAVGYRSSFSFTGSENFPASNVSVGALSLYANLNGAYNTAIGYEAAYTGTDPFYTTSVGYRALYANQAYYNTATGAQALEANTSGTENAAFGYFALPANTTGNYNSALGSQTMVNNTTGAYNVAQGFRALRLNVSGVHNTASGVYSLAANTGSYNTAAGSNALASNTTGQNNNALGYLALSNNTTGNANTAGGSRALGNNTTGVNNAALGYGALLTNTSGSLNTAVGMNADVTTGALSNATAIGYGAKVNASNKVRIGNASVTVIEGQVPFTTPSDGRFKYNVKEDVGGLAFILKLRPVTYQFDVKKFDNLGDINFASAKNDAYEKAALIRRTGFIAQEVEKAAQETNYNFSGVIRPESEKEHYSLSYESFVVPLVKAVQEQQQTITAQQQVIDEQKKQIEDLLRRMEKVENK